MGVGGYLRLCIILTVFYVRTKLLKEILIHRDNFECIID